MSRGVEAARRLSSQFTPDSVNDVLDLIFAEARLPDNFIATGRRLDFLHRFRDIRNRPTSHLQSSTRLLSRSIFLRPPSKRATMVYLRQEKLPNLRQYKYSGVDHSLLSRYVLKPFYTKVVIKCFPMSMAPNLITLTGFSFVIINMLTLLWYNPTLDQDCPPWVYASWALGLFLYQTFDAVDGTQA